MGCSTPTDSMEESGVMQRIDVVHVLVLLVLCLLLTSVTLALSSTERVWLMACTSVLVLDVWYHQVLCMYSTTLIEHSICSSVSSSTCAVVLHLHYVIVLCLCVAMLCVLVYAHCYMTHEVYCSVV